MVMNNSDWGVLEAAMPLLTTKHTVSLVRALIDLN